MINNFGLFNSLVVIIGSLLIIINIVLSPFNPYAEKNNPFECGFLSFIWQNRVQFSISFFIFALLFLLFDLEVLLVFPYFVSTYTNDIAGLVSMVIFLLLLVIGFGFELGKKALKINSKQLQITFIDIDEAKKNSFVNTASIEPIGISVVTGAIIGGLILIASRKKNSIFIVNNFSFSSLINKYLKIIQLAKIKSLFSTAFTKLFSWVNDNLPRILTIFLIGFTTRYFINEWFGINVFTQYINPVSIAYYLSLSGLMVLFKDIGLTVTKLITWTQNIGWKSYSCNKIILQQGSESPHLYYLNIFREFVEKNLNLEHVDTMLMGDMYEPDKTTSQEEKYRSDPISFPTTNAMDSSESRSEAGEGRSTHVQGTGAGARAGARAGASAGASAGPRGSVVDLTPAVREKIRGIEDLLNKTYPEIIRDRHRIDDNLGNMASNWFKEIKEDPRYIVSRNFTAAERNLKEFHKISHKVADFHFHILQHKSKLHSYEHVVWGPGYSRVMELYDISLPILINEDKRWNDKPWELLSEDHKLKINKAKDHLEKCEKYLKEEIKKQEKAGEFNEKFILTFHDMVEEAVREVKQAKAKHKFSLKEYQMSRPCQLDAHAFILESREKSIKDRIKELENKKKS